MAAGELMEDHHEEFDAEEDNVDDHSHKKLLNAVSQIYRKQRIAAPKRNEPFQQISEFNLTKSGRRKKLGARDLLKDLNKKAAHLQITRKIESIQRKVKPLPKPLEKHQADKLTRQAGFNTVEQELWKWEALIQRNRAADQLVFPLKDETVKFERNADFLSTFTKPSELELKMAEALKKSLLCQEGKQDEEPDEKMTLAELFKRRNMVAKMRARESYRIAKAVRQNKIKSKKYHRLLKRDKIKKELKEFELLQKTDPEAALAKLERVEKARAEERISLRHRNTGKWAKGLALRAKYDSEARSQLADNLKKSREITEKLKSSMATDSEDDDDEDFNLNGADKSAENPWVAESEVASFVSGYRKFWEEQNKRKEEGAQKDGTASLVVSGGSAGGISDEDEETDGPSIGPAVDRAGEVESSASEKTSPLKNKAVSPSKTRNVTVENLVANAEDGSSDTRVGDDDSNAFIESTDDNNVVETPTTVESSTDAAGEAGQTEVVVSCTSADESVTTPRKRRRKRNSNKAVKSRDNSGTWSVVEMDNNSMDGVHVTKKGEDSQSNVTREKIVQSGSNRKSFDTSSNKSLDEKSSVVKKRKLEDMFEQVQMSIDEAIPKKFAQMKYLANPKPLTPKLKESTTPGKKSHHTDLSFKKSKATGVDESLIEIAGDATGISSGMNDIHKLVDRLDNSAAAPKETQLPDIDPQKFIPVKKQKLATAIPDFEEGGDSESDDENEKQHMNLMEAFADDDIADEFRKEKEEEEEDFKPKVVDLSLPGWGSWGGSGIVDTKKNRRNRKIAKFPKITRKDAKRNSVIINEEPSAKFTKLMVSDLPQQYNSVAAYEAAIRAPIGDTWVTQAAHNALTAPQVITKMGAIIAPLDASMLLKKEQKDKPLKVNGDLDKSPKKKFGVKKNSSKNGKVKKFRNTPFKKGNRRGDKKKIKTKS